MLRCDPWDGDEDKDFEHEWPDDEWPFDETITSVLPSKYRRYVTRANVPKVLEDQNAKPLGKQA